jgi:WXG100 family type VII secretion target
MEMRFMAQIRINYGEVKGQTKKIEELSKKLNVVNGSLKNLVGEVSSAWSGPASQAYIGQCDTLHELINNTIKKMNYLAEDIVTIADRIKNEDEDTAHIANKLKK